MKYPNRVAGASRNISVRPMASRQTAAGTVFGGQTTSEAAIPTPASTSSAIATMWPSGPVSASTWPGSGLAAADLTPARPSGNSIVFAASGPGQIAAIGPTIARHETTAQPRKVSSGFLPSRVPISTAATATAGHAVDFAADARPSAIPASANRGRRHSSANPRHIRATIGMSSPPTASSNAITGHAAINTVQRTQFFAPAARSASQKMTTNASPNQTRGSVMTCEPNNARGIPNRDITGRYGLYAFGLWVAASDAALWYGE